MTDQIAFINTSEKEKEKSSNQAEVSPLQPKTLKFSEFKNKNKINNHDLMEEETTNNNEKIGDNINNIEKVENLDTSFKNLDDNISNNQNIITENFNYNNDKLLIEENDNNFNNEEDELLNQIIEKTESKI